MMDANQVLDSFVRDVAACLPRARRNDVTLELRALLALGHDLCREWVRSGPVPAAAPR